MTDDWVPLTQPGPPAGSVAFQNPRFRSHTQLPSTGGWSWNPFVGSQLPLCQGNGRGGQNREGQTQHDTSHTSYTRDAHVIPPNIHPYTHTVHTHIHNVPYPLFTYRQEGRGGDGGESNGA
jgi:hypothetical protein